ncbi:hypothetical protein DL98DRAFT_57980 [Cadophora sp. DSE1049]|nr:hypothetical protein DL98DRAFT_57980 [Cadophora sp. DSE1049]
MSPETFFRAVNDTILFGVHDRNFKGGVFKYLIPRNTQAVQALNVFLNSTLLSTTEKIYLCRFMENFLTVAASYTNGAEPDIRGFSLEMGRVITTFDRARGDSYPPWMWETLKVDSSVRDRHIWDQITRAAAIVTPVIRPPTQTNTTEASDEKGQQKDEAKEKKPNREHSNRVRVFNLLTPSQVTLLFPRSQARTTNPSSVTASARIFEVLSVRCSLHLAFARCTGGVMGSLPEAIWRLQDISRFA